MPKPTPAGVARFFFIMAAAFVATSIVIDQEPYSTRAIPVIVTIYLVYYPTHLACGLFQILRTPGFKDCVEHLNLRAPQALRITAWFSTILIPTVPALILRYSTDDPTTMHYCIATGAAAAITAIILTRMTSKTIIRRFREHLPDCPNDMPAPTGNVVDSVAR